MMDVKYCLDCEDDFYNGKNPMGVQRCWMLKTAKVVRRFWIGTWDDPTLPGAFREADVPDCYRRKGRHFSNSLPDFVKPEHVVKLGVKRAPEKCGRTTADEYRAAHDDGSEPPEAA